MRIATRTCNKQLTKQDPNAVTRASLPAQHTALSCKQCTRSVVLARLVTHKKRDGLRGKMSSKTARAAIALKSGVVMGGTAILSAVNGLTPHMAGAIDIMVVQQPDGTLKCSPFYVRFGKYTPMRSKDKKVHILINGEQADISMHLGAYGQAYFAAQTMEIVSDAEDEDILQGMMSPPSGYSSDEDAPYANQEILSAVQQEVQRIKATQQAAKAAAVAAASGEQPASPKAVAAAAAAKATGAAAIQQLAAAGEADTIAEAAAAADAQAGMSNVEAAAAHGINPATVAAAAAAVAAVIGQLDTSAGAAVEQALQSLDAQASTRAGQAEAGRESDSSSGLSDTLTSDDVARAITNGLATANNSSSRPHVAYSSGHQAGSPAAQQDSSSVGNSPTISSSSTSNKPYKKHRRPTPLVLHVPGDGAAEDPARSKLQDLLLDNRYSVRVRSENSFTASEAGAAAAQAAQLMMDDDILQQQQEQDDQQQLEQQQQQPQGDVRFLNDAGALHWKLHHDDLQLQKQQQQHQQHPAPSSPQQHQQDGGEQQAEPARRHVGFEVSSPPSQFHNSAVAATGGQQRTASRLRPSEAAIASKLPAGSSGLKRILQGNLPSVLDSAASYSVDEVSGLTLSADGDVDRTSSMASVDSPIAAAAAEQAAGEASSTAASTIGDQQELGSAELAHSEPLAVQNSSSNNEHEVLSSICETGDVQQRRRNRDGLLSSSLRATAAAQQQLAEQQQQPVQPAPKQQQPMASTSSGVVSQEQCSAPAPSTTIGLSDSTFDIQPQPAGQAAEDAESAAAGSTVAAPKTPGVHSSPDLGVSSPVVVPNGPAASPPVDHSGYLGDSEQGELLGTSLDATTPRRLAAAVDMGSGSGPLALGLAGFQLSLCGNQLRPGMPAAEAQQVFETQRVPAQMWSERGVGLMNDPNLVVKVGGSLYSWEVAAPIVVGMLAFGGKWDSLLGLDPSGIYPIKVAEDHSSTSKKSGGGSSWRLWPFSGWRESGSNKQQAPLGSSPPPSGLQQQRQQSQPSAATAGTGSSGDRDSAGDAVQSSGSSLTNLLLLGSPGSKSAALEKATYSVSADAGSTAQQAATAAAVNRLFGGSPRATSGGSKSVAFATSPESSPFRSSRKKHIILIRKTLTPPSDQLARLPLKWGQNTITFRATGAADLTAYIYLLRWNTRLVISDVDGTITRSDLLGHVLPTLGVDWSHPGITQLFHNIDSNGYQIMFLSSRWLAGLLGLVKTVLSRAAASLRSATTPAAVVTVVVCSSCAPVSECDTWWSEVAQMWLCSLQGQHDAADFHSLVQDRGELPPVHVFILHIKVHKEASLLCCVCTVCPLQGHCSGQHHTRVPAQPCPGRLQDAIRACHHITTWIAAILV
eukprot:GHRR01014462.1.p1 GENE.GHRR01014462.1~~GHRR01014462.1.p1  ORF type:complete len:1371 (+),score=557.88 GHRR01014462.1:43-4155(+)